MAKHALGRPATSTCAVLRPTLEVAAVPARYHRRSVSAFLVGATALGGAAFLPGLAVAAPASDSHCTASAGTTTCTYTAADGNVDFVAPAGVTSFSVTASGAAGGNGGTSTTPGGGAVATGGTGGTGGAGTEITEQVTVGANRTYALLVGAKGANGLTGNGTNDTGGAGGGGRAEGGRGGDSFGGGGGGGGGGATSVTQSNGSDVVLVAGGGAGGGGGGIQGNGGTGQASGSTAPGANGGAGADASSSGTFNTFPAYNGGGGGGGGGLQGGGGGTAGTTDSPGTGGFAGTSTATGTTGSTGDGTLVITYATPTANPPAPSTGADLTTTVDAPDTLAVGQDGAITVTVTNNGTVAAQNVRTRVSIPSGLRVSGGDRSKPTQATLAPGASVTYTYEVVGTKQRPRVPVFAVSTSRTKDTNIRDNYDTEYVAVTR